MDRNCQHCAGRSNWEFLKEFYERDENATKKISNLNQHIGDLNAALHHAGLTSQKDRLALNNAHRHQQELQKAYEASELARAQNENSLHEERQEHRACQEALNHERVRHEETEKHLSCVWNANLRLEKIFSSIRGEIDEENSSGACETYNVSSLVLEVEAKVLRISQLESVIEDERQKNDVEICKHEESTRILTLQHAEDVLDKNKAIEDLEKSLRESQSQLELKKMMKKRRRRNRKRSGEASHDIISSHPHSRE